MPMTDDQLRDTMNARMSPSARLLGMNILEVDSKAGRVLMTFEPRPEFCNPMGNLQGGIIRAASRAASSPPCSMMPRPMRP